jgi:hypothetical protein
VKADSAESPVRDELLVQLITLASGIAGVIIMIELQRRAAGPDAWRSARMRAAKRMERGWARLAAWSWRRAERDRLAYERERA